MKICVTGGCGFIGSNYVREHLKKHPNDVIFNIDALTYAGNIENLETLTDDEKVRYEFVRGDIADSQFVMGLFQKNSFDAVVNFAAESHVDRSIKYPDVFVRTNVLGTQNLLNAAKETGVARYLQVSTDEVYGSLPPTGAFYETTPLAPRSPYSASKASADHLVMAYHHTFGLDTVITRCSNNYGPYQFPEKLLPLITLNALHDKELPIYGDGKQRREWLHIHDHCNAIEMVLAKGRSGEVYNIGGENEHCNIDIVKIILNTLGKPKSLMKYVQDRPGHDRRYCINADKIKAELGWKPEIDFNEGIVSTIRWFADNPKWWQDILSGEYMKYYKMMYDGR